MKGLLILVIALIGAAQAATREPDISQAVATCEREVPAFCASTSCPQFCDGFATSGGRTRCRAECTAAKRCGVKANVASQNIRGNEALDTQNREQLIRCIAQTRDPNFTRTGMTREDTPWRQYQTNSFKNAIRPRSGSRSSV